MIYQVTGYINKTTYYVDQQTFDSSNVSEKVALIIGTKEDAELLLTQNQNAILANETLRFSICATFIDGNNTTWREIQESDPEDTICQVFDTLTGTYTQVQNKTEAIALNEQKKQAFLESVGLDKVYELSELPSYLTQPVSQGTQTL